VTQLKGYKREMQKIVTAVLPHERFQPWETIEDDRVRH
jgi:hypothetical protein